MPKPLEHIVHTMGWPLRKRAKYGEFGGSFIYPMGDDMVSLGFVAGLEYRDVEFSVHDVLQEFKTHRLVRKILARRRADRVGREDDHRGRLPRAAEAVPRAGPAARGRERGPRQRADAEGDPLRDRVRDHGGRGGVPVAPARRVAEPRRRARRRTTRSCAASYVVKDLHEVRNMRQVFDKGFFMGGALASAMTVTKGNLPPKELRDRARTPSAR